MSDRGGAEFWAKNGIGKYVWLKVGAMGCKSFVALTFLSKDRRTQSDCVWMSLKQIGNSPIRNRLELVISHWKWHLLISIVILLQYIKYITWHCTHQNKWTESNSETLTPIQDPETMNPLDSIPDPTPNLLHPDLTPNLNTWSQLSMSDTIPKPTPPLPTWNPENPFTPHKEEYLQLYKETEHYHHWTNGHLDNLTKLHAQIPPLPSPLEVFTNKEMVMAHASDLQVHLSRLHYLYGQGQAADTHHKLPAKSVARPPAVLKTALLTVYDGTAPKAKTFLVECCNFMVLNTSWSGKQFYHSMSSTLLGTAHTHPYEWTETNSETLTPICDPETMNPSDSTPDHHLDLLPPHMIPMQHWTLIPNISAWSQLPRPNSTMMPTPPLPMWNPRDPTVLLKEEYQQLYKDTTTYHHQTDGHLKPLVCQNTEHDDGANTDCKVCQNTGTTTRVDGNKQWPFINHMVGAD